MEIDEVMAEHYRMKDELAKEFPTVEALAAAAREAGKRFEKMRGKFGKPPELKPFRYKLIYLPDEETPKKVVKRRVRSGKKVGRTVAKPKMKGVSRGKAAKGK